MWRKAKVKDLMKWVESDLRYSSKFSEYAHVIGEECGSKELKGIVFLLYTETYQYQIRADESRNYLGCTYVARKSKPGEDWCRGGDLADGKFTKATWERIRKNILGREFLRLAVSQGGAPEEKVPIQKEAGVMGKFPRV